MKSECESLLSDITLLSSTEFKSGYLKHFVWKYISCTTSENYHCKLTTLLFKERSLKIYKSYALYSGLG